MSNLDKNEMGKKYFNTLTRLQFKILTFWIFERDTKILKLSRNTPAWNKEIVFLAHPITLVFQSGKLKRQRI